MTRILYLLLIITLLNVDTYSQEKWILKYDADWIEIMTDSTNFSFYREFQEINSYTARFVSFSADSIKVETGFMRYNQLHGKVTSYFKNGNIEYEGEYKNGKPIGIWKENYNNGKPRNEYTIIGEHEGKYLKKHINYWDSLGNALITNGKGYLTIYKDKLTYKGEYKDGMLNGELKIYNASDSLLFIEKYSHGKFFSGLNNVNKKTYNAIFTMPEYKEGDKAFDNMVRRYMKEQYKDRREDVGAPFSTVGAIDSEIVVSKDGKITSVELIKTRKSLLTELLLEAIKKTSQDWLSATLRSEAIEQKFNYTFYFDLRTGFQKLSNFRRSQNQHEAIRIMNSLSK